MFLISRDGKNGTIPPTIENGVCDCLLAKNNQMDNAQSEMVKKFCGNNQGINYAYMFAYKAKRTTIDNFRYFYAISSAIETKTQRSN